MLRVYFFLRSCNAETKSECSHHNISFVLGIFHKTCDTIHSSKIALSKFDYGDSAQIEFFKHRQNLSKEQNFRDFWRVCFTILEANDQFFLKNIIQYKPLLVQQTFSSMA